MEPEITKDTLLALGLVFPVFGGIQIDLNVVLRAMPDGSTQPASLCDHNCTDEVGGYTCPAAFTLNKGAKPKFALGSDLLFWIQMGRSGLILARNAFLEKYFADYCRTFVIPVAVQAILAESLRSDLCEVNLFGGNPEMHPEVIWLIRELKARNFRVNLTTTGRRFLTNKKFVRDFVDNLLHLLALSADDFDPERLDELFTMPLNGLASVWKRINPLHGQAQKLVEGIYAARLVQEKGISTTVLFNMVLHRGNLRYVRRIMEAISRYLPKALVNPYPAQDSFECGSGHLLSAENIQEFTELVDFFTNETRRGNSNLTKQIQYWLVMGAILENCREHPMVASELIAGHYIWQCYRHEPVPGAGMYLQIGKNNPNLVNIGNDTTQPGGYPGCYWQNNTVTGPVQVQSAEQIAHHILGGMQELAAETLSPCRGCSMPRLWFNMVTTELGLNPGLRESYLRLRRQHVGF
ncbi:MAG: hypothetical protein COT34_02670 [Candidatus Nealsonbacteria bacterium CG08_land_8_20_14_0_20_43_11]|uniref:Radical SAM core domain-containing protein n=1 Tax=Candidatus Nealsonbacteria bacterium CG08_land_8_20_14_0_20_43_11 TaxID=1974706 RepID=A0A2M6T0L3_9BACT|nr:MAG: hypothetical protein COT34_02670 [Candidatus Nealsonbacteria bacterium CG08_land_8_20_14_0_20_43_11]